LLGGIIDGERRAEMKNIVSALEFVVTFVVGVLVGVAALGYHFGYRPHSPIVWDNLGEKLKRQHARI
jgi:hypothetical protein